jgi:hypothetical protein
MQQRPTKTELLQAIAKFLVAEAYPSISDKRLSFRVLIAANLANMVSAELESENALIDEEIARLADLMPDAVAGRAPAESEAERRELLSQLHRELAERIRLHRFSAEEKRRAWNEVKESLSRTLAIDNPRFDRSQKIE